MAMTDRDQNISNQFLKRLKPHQFDQAKFVIRNRHRWVAFQDAIRLVKVVKPEMGAELRAPIEAILRRHAPETQEEGGVAPSLAADVEEPQQASPAIDSEPEEPIEEVPPEPQVEEVLVSQQPQTQDVPQEGEGEPIDYSYQLAMQFEEIAPGEKV